MGWQETVVFLVVTGTAATFLWNYYRRRKDPLKARVVCGGCVSGPAHLRTEPRVTFRARRGERPEVRVEFK